MARKHCRSDYATYNFPVIGPSKNLVVTRLTNTIAHDESEQNESGVAVEEAKPKLAKPPLYKVVMLNDDYTPMEFVVHVLEKFFSLNRPTATRVMLEVHTQGKGVCGIFTREVAETKVSQVNAYARDHDHPLLSTLELES